MRKKERGGRGKGREGKRDRRESLGDRGRRERGREKGRGGKI